MYGYRNKDKVCECVQEKGVPSPRLTWQLPLPRPSWEKNQYKPLMEDHSLKDLQLSASRMLKIDLYCYGKASFVFTGKDACFVHQISFLVMLQQTLIWGYVDNVI